MLNQSQVRWIIKQIDTINFKYMNQLPFDVETWEVFLEDTKEIYNKTKMGRKEGNQDIEKIVVELIRFYDVMNTRMGGK